MVVYLLDNAITLEHSSIRHLRFTMGRPLLVTLMIIFVGEYIHKTQARLPQCLDTSCESTDGLTGKSLPSSCEPLNLRMNVASLGRISISPKNATCGSPPVQFCSLKNRIACMECNNKAHTEQRHPPNHMIDGIKWTWWQSKPWPGLPGRPFEVNITVNLPKTFLLIDDIIVDFYDGLPQKMIVDKSSDYGRTWQTMQYYADNCMQFGMNSTVLDHLWTDPFSALRPFCSTGYSTNYIWKDQSLLKVSVSPRLRILRRNGFNDSKICSAINDKNSEIMKFLLITNIRIRLLRPPMVQADISNDMVYQHSEHYGIKKIYIPGRCYCNGHAGDCDYDSKSVRCSCRHFTEGRDCEKCKALYWMKPWEPGYYSPVNVRGNVKQCTSFRDLMVEQRGERKVLNLSSTIIPTITRLKCNCNGHSERCETVGKLGTLCVDCRHHTIGRNCDGCRQEFFRDNRRTASDLNVCKACNCSPLGSIGKWCQPFGQCKCRGKFVGKKCNRCQAGWILDKAYCVRLLPECKAKRKLCKDVKFTTDTSDSSLKCISLKSGWCSCINSANCTVPKDFINAKQITNNSGCRRFFPSMNNFFISSILSYLVLRQML